MYFSDVMRRGFFYRVTTKKKNVEIKQIKHVVWIESKTMR